MNVFILCTGRSGSTAFMKACTHITNFTCGHESRSSFIGEERLNYPKWHIESDNRLSWFLGALDKKYGDNDVLYVHLTRDRENTVKSFSDRWNVRGSILRAFSGGILMRAQARISQGDKEQICRDYYDTVNSNIELFLKDKSNKMSIPLKDMAESFKEFWHLSGAKGDIGAALSEFDRGHNEGVWKKRAGFGSAHKSVVEFYRKVKLVFWDLGIS